jgi:membrane protein DedA with SNARE-associated domain
MDILLSMDILSFIDSYKYYAIFILLMLNGLSNLPSSQIVYLAIGYYVSVGKLDFTMSVILGASGNILGNFILSFIIRKYGIDVARKFTYINDKALTDFGEKVSKSGLLYLTVSKLVPNLKILVPVIIGITNLSFLKSLFVYTVGSTLWAIIVVKIGMYFGSSISWQYYTLAVTLMAIVVMSLFYLRFIKTNESK